MKTILCILSLTISAVLVMAGPPGPKPSQDFTLKCKNEELKIPDEYKIAMKECYKEVFKMDSQKDGEKRKEKLEKENKPDKEERLKPEKKEQRENNSDIKKMKNKPGMDEKMMEIASCKGEALGIIDSQGNFSLDQSLEVVDKVFPQNAAIELKSLVTECFNKAPGALNIKGDNFMEVMKCGMQSFHQVCFNSENSDN